MSSKVQSKKTGRYVAMGVAFIPVAATAFWLSREQTRESILAFLTAFSAWTAILTR